jgi:hypothetical protein
MQEKKELSYDRDRRKLGNRCGFLSVGRPTIVNRRSESGLPTPVEN